MPCFSNLRTKVSSQHKLPVLLLLRDGWFPFHGKVFRVHSGGVRITTAKHSGCTLFKMAANCSKIGKFYILFFPRIDDKNRPKALDCLT